MPLVQAIPQSQTDGTIVTQFVDTTSTTAVTYTYPVAQTGLHVVNKGEEDIFVAVGSYNDIRIAPNDKWKTDTDYISFSIRSSVNSQSFLATARIVKIENVSEIANQLSTVTSRVASIEQRLDDLYAGGKTLLLSSAQLEKVKKWADNYLEFMDRNTGDFENISINNLGLVGGSFVQDEPLTSYTPPTTSTSEAQLLVIRGLLKNYIATKEAKWLERAEWLTEALLKYYYPYYEIPELPDEKWIPHWLVNVTAPFVSRELFLDGEAHFTNGVAVVNFDKVFRVFSARSSDSTLEHRWNPESGIVGIKYEIERTEVKYGESEATIYLKNKTYTGPALIVYTSETGKEIGLGEKCEAFPTWRPLDEGELACAVDALSWALDVFDLWHSITKEKKWLNAINSTKESIRVVSSVTNTTYFIQGKESGEEILVDGITGYSTREPQEVYKNLDGLLHIDYLDSPEGEASIGTWVGDKLDFSLEKCIELKIGSNKPGKVYLAIDELSGFSPERRWKADIWLKGNGLSKNELEAISLYPGDFYNDDDIVWGFGYGKTNNGSSISSSNSTALKSEEIGDVNGKNRPYTNLDFVRGDEGGWLGWSQWMLSIWDYLLPFDICYKTENEIAFMVNDSAGEKFTYTLPKTNGKFKTITLKKELFETSVNVIAEGNYNSIGLDAIDEFATLKIDYIGKKAYMDKDYYTYVTFGYKEADALRVAIEHIKPGPSREPLPYAPYILPFDFHLVNYEVSNLRGAIYSGYQVPWIYQKGIYKDDNLGLNTNLQFLLDAQDSYESYTGVRGFFAPIFWWDYREDYGDNEPNTFGWDKDNTWGGFQYRTISDVARVLSEEPHNIKAKEIFMSFIKAVDNCWIDTLKGFPTEFPKDQAPYNNQTDAHMVTNFCRSLLYGLNTDRLTATETKLILKLIEKCLDYLEYWHVPVDESENLVSGTWSPNPEAKTWYSYWGGDILDMLGMLQMVAK